MAAQGPRRAVFGVAAKLSQEVARTSGSELEMGHGF